MTDVRKRNMRNIQEQPRKPVNHRRMFRLKHSQTIEEKWFNIETISEFKRAPVFLPENFTTKRPLMGSCCACMPHSQKEFFSSNLRELGMRNILDVRNEMPNGGIFTKYFVDVIYALRHPLFSCYVDLTKSVLTSPRVLNAIETVAAEETPGSADDSDVPMQAIQKQCLTILRRMKASVSSVFIRLTAWFLTKFLTKFLRSVQICRGQMAMVKQASLKNVPMIYLPLHRSHLDYILVTLILWHYDIRAPLVAAGDNMDIPVFNFLMRSLGGFFIRRRLDSKIGKKDLVYRAVLHEYMTKLLSHGEGLEFFIEGGRTRTGRAVIPKGGLLSVVIEACMEGEISDAYIVPVTFSYERIIDGNFNREQMGQAKVQESFWGALRAIGTILFNNYGSVRVDFAQPFSLRELIKSSKTSSMYSNTLCQAQSLQASSYPNLSQTLLSSNGEADSTKMIVKALADHTVFTAGHMTAPMKTHILAFLLLTKYRQGATIKELVQGVEWVIRQLEALQVDVGFCGQATHAVLYGQALLGQQLVTVERHRETGEVKMCPNLSLPLVFELAYYSNLVTVHFALESVVAAAVMYQGGLSLHHLPVTSQWPQNTVTKDKVLETAELLCMIIHNEFIFTPPCENLSTTLANVLDSFILKEILSTEDNLQNSELAFTGKDRKWAERMAMAFDVHEEEDIGLFMPQQSLTVNVDREDVKEHLLFLVRVLGPVFESHLLVAKYLQEELVSELTEDELIATAGEYARRREKEGLVIFSESCALIDLKSAVKSYQDMEVLYSYSCAGLTMLGLRAACDLGDCVQLLQSVLT